MFHFSSHGISDHYQEKPHHSFSIICCSHCLFFDSVYRRTALNSGPLIIDNRNLFASVETSFSDILVGLTVSFAGGKEAENAGAIVVDSLLFI